MPIFHTLSNRRELLILALMLELLHFSIWLDFTSPISRSLLLIHLGLFLIWQPVWRHDEQISWYNSLVFILLTLTFVTFIHWGLLFGWLILLCGFAGGRIIINRQERAIYMTMLVFLVSELIIICTPRLFNIELSERTSDVFKYIWLIPLAITVLPYTKEQARIQSVDLQHALATSTLIAVLIFGSLLNMYISEVEYLTSLLQALIIIVLFLFTISWMLSPRTGFSGLSQLWSKSLLNIGTPFEQWLSEIARVSQQQQTADTFLEVVMEELVSLPWIEGVKWTTRDKTGNSGKLEKHEVEFTTDNLVVNMYTYNPVGGALFLHCNLLVQVIDNFYVGKVRERKLTQQAQIQAIHETGARITHDIKNLLQSLQAITSLVIDDSNSIDKATMTRLFGKQMPHLTQRLQLALDKLQKPEDLSQEQMRLEDWWNGLKNRHDESNLNFYSDFDNNPLIPADLFDSVLENLLENLKEKKQLERELKVSIHLTSREDTASLVVTDDGTKIAEEKAEVLLKEPVKSENGLGIGLYQTARQAESMDYSLILKNNENGNVCFELIKNLSLNDAERN